MRPIELRCEHRRDVPCVDDPAPRLSWALESSERGKRQSAYRGFVVRWTRPARSCGTAGTSSPPLGRRRLRRAPRSRRRATAGGPCRSGTRRAAVAVERAGVLPDRPARVDGRSGSRATTATIRACRCPRRDSERADDIMLERCRPARPYPAPRVRACRDRSAARCSTRPPGGCRAASQRRAVGDACSRRGGPTTASASSTRPTTSPSCSPDGPTCSAAILGDGWYFAASTSSARGAHYGTARSCSASSTSSYADGSCEVVATTSVARDDRADPLRRTCCTASTTTPAARSAAGRTRATTTRWRRS